MDALSTYNKFGKKMKELIKVVNETEGWEEYVEDNTVILINDLLIIQNLGAIMIKHDISYTNLRAKYIVASERIKTQNNSRIRFGKSGKARQLLDLVSSTPDWMKALTDREITYVNAFQKFKSFYEVGRKLDVKPSNVAGTLYGTNQRVGVIGKITELKALKI